MKHVVFAAFLACGCAGIGPVTDGEQTLEVRTAAWTPHATLGESFKVLREVQGAQCTLRNDKGTWTVTTPAIVRVSRSSIALEVDCAKEGFRRAQQSEPCLAPGQSMSKREQTEMAFALITLPVAIAAAPLVPGAAIPLAGQALTMGAGAAMGSGSRGDPSCYGSRLAVLLEMQ